MTKKRVLAPAAVRRSLSRSQSQCRDELSCELSKLPAGCRNKKVSESSDEVSSFIYMLIY